MRRLKPRYRGRDMHPKTNAFCALLREFPKPMIFNDELTLGGRLRLRMSMKWIEVDFLGRKRFCDQTTELGRIVIKSYLDARKNVSCETKKEGAK